MLVAVMLPTSASTPRPSPGRAKVTEATAELKRNRRVPWTIEAPEQPGFRTSLGDERRLKLGSW